MASVKNRENTFKVDLSNFPKRPTFEEIHKFVHEVIGLRVDQVKRLQMNHSQNCAHVKCTDLQTALDIVDNHNEKHELEVNDRKIKVRLVMDEAGVEVKIHDLSENVTNEQICEFLKQYGDVTNIQEIVWGEKFAFKGVPTGIRIAKMTLKKHIKSFVSIQGEQTLITYRNQPQTCKHCTNILHPGVTCVQNKKLLGQKNDLDKRLKNAQNKSNETSYAKTLSRNDPVTAIMPQFSVIPSGQISSTSTRTITNEIAVSQPPNTSDESPRSSDTTALESEQANEINPPDVPATGAVSQTNEGNISNKLIPYETREFKIPVTPINAHEIEISENDSVESSTDNENSFQKFKRVKSRSKKLKLDPSMRTSSTVN